MRPSPFHIGDAVVYRPSDKGFNSDAMSEHLIPGKTYTVKAIQQERYIVVENYNHPGGGIYWTEFAPVD